MTRLRTANLLAALASDIVERVDTELKSHPNQTDSWLAALNIMSFWDGITNAELASALGLSHPATSRLVEKLQAQGLVETRSGADRRASYLYLLPAGLKLVEPALIKRCVVVERYLSPLSPEEHRQLEGLLEKLVRPLAGGDLEVSHFCRLCSFSSCPGEVCPMHSGVTGETPPSDSLS